jgi:antitoxin MazE
MKTKIQKWGNSLGLRIPKSFAEAAEVEVGTTVDVSVSNGRLVIKPVEQTRYRLTDLLDGVTEQNIHGEISTGRRRGKETW